MTQSHTPAVEALPVVGYLHTMDNTEGIPGNTPWVTFSASKRNPFGKPGIDYSRTFPVTKQALTPLAPAQAQIDALRIENERLRRELAGMGDPWISCLDRVPQGREPVIVISRGWDKPKVLSYEIRMLKDGPWERFIDNDTGRWYWYPERMHWMHLPDYSDLIEAGKDHGHE